MKYSLTFASLRPSLGALVTLLAAAPSFAQTDDFNDGNDTGWTRFDVLAPFNGGTGAQFTFPDGGYRITAYVSPNSGQLGPGRAFSMRAGTTYSDFYVTVDVVDWDQQLNQAFGIIGRVTSPGLGTSDGYVFNYNPRQSANSGQLQINRVDGEQPTTIAAQDVTLDPAKDYRFVFRGVGADLTGAVYELPLTGTPFISIAATDADHASGIFGIFVYDRSDVSNAAATFDNYFAAASEPQAQPPTIGIGSVAGGNLQLGFATQAGFSYQVQQANALPAQPADWMEVETYPAESTDGSKVFSVPVNSGNGFIRVVTPAPAE